MPHIIVEHSEQLENDTQVDTVLNTIHHSIAESGLFKADQIKTRTYPFKHFINARGSESYIHIHRIKGVGDKCVSLSLVTDLYHSSVPGTLYTG